ncbi:MAG: ribosome maturation factor RimM [Alphaproteobacteria bacterium]|nr:ribosome maturation factor RimM [Alphaproteobacteria bacterium]
MTGTRRHSTTADRALLGVIVAAHGVRGQVRVKSFTADPAAIAAYGPLEDDAGNRYLLRVSGGSRGAVIATIEGITDRTRAEALKGVHLHVGRAHLPALAPEEFYHRDLIGLAAELPDGSRLGEVQAVHDFGAGDLIEIARVGAEPLLVPFTREMVPMVDLGAGRLVIDPPAGLLEP